MAHTTKAMMLAGAALLLGATAGCSAGASTYADLTNDPPVNKPIPTDLESQALEGFDTDSIRWVGEYGGSQLWLAAGTGDFEVCLLQYADAQEWSGSCSGGNGISSSRIGDGPQFQVVPDGQEPREGSDRVSTNVYATGA